MVLPVFLLATSVAHAFTSAHLSSQRYGSTSDDNGLAVAVDAAGNVYLTGTFQGTVDFGGGGLVSAGATDIFVAKYNASGAHVWSARAGGTGTDTPYGVAANGSGEVYVTGSFSGTADFGGSNLVSAGGNDMFLVKYTSTGFALWSQRFGSTGGEEGRGIGLDFAGNIYLTGDFGGTVDFGGGNLVSAGLNDMILAKYTSGGAHVWSKRFGGTNFDMGYALAVDGMGNFVVAGSFGNTVDFGGGNLVSAGVVDVVLARYTSAGTHVWSQRFGGSSLDEGFAVTMDFAGNVIATGYFNGPVNFGGSNLVGAGGNDIFVAKYNGMGAHQWSYGFGGTISDLGRGVAVDGSGNVFTTGMFQNTANLGSGNVTSAGGFDAYVVKYNAAGVHQWSRRSGSTFHDIGLAVAVEASGNVVTTGAFSGTVSFGGSPLVSVGADIFLARYAGGTAEPVITSIADIGNDQGRKVKISFTRSGHDQANAASPIVHYEAYRRSDAAPAISIGLEAPDAALFPGWTMAGAVYAHGDTQYSIDVPTIGDSTLTLGQYYSAFFIRAATAVPTAFNDSPPDSGYSLDNLAPAVPQNLAFDTGDLSWDESTAADFDYFTVYGSNTNSFGSAVVVDYAVAPSMNVSGSPYVYYYVTATDYSGNEGKPAKVNTLSGVGGTPTSYVLSVSNYPNPFNPRTTVRYTVPSRGEVSIRVYDIRGTYVVSLVQKEHATGVYSVEWDGRDADGTVVGSGMYFARIEHNGAMRSKKMVLLK
jgi:hypothetical protein